MENPTAKKNLIAIDEYLQILQRSHEAVKLMKKRAIETDCHKRAITATATIAGLIELIEDLEHGRLICMEILGTKKVPIVVERKLKLIKGGK